jgi:hypothetical protein
MIPQALVNALRVQANVSLANYGQDCILYIPTTVSYNAAEKLDVFAKPEDFEFISYNAKVFIEWQPTAYKLKKLGLYVEDNLPIIAWFGTVATAREGSEAGTQVGISVCKQSYFEIAVDTVPEGISKASQFEVINPSLKGFQDSEILRCYSIAPRRITL